MNLIYTLYGGLETVRNESRLHFCKSRHAYMVVYTELAVKLHNHLTHIVGPCGLCILSLLWTLIINDYDGYYDLINSLNTKSVDY